MTDQTKLPPESEISATKIPTRRMPLGQIAPDQIPTATFQTGDQGSWRRSEIKKPNTQLKQGSGGRDVDDNSPFKEPANSNAANSNRPS